MPPPSKIIPVNRFTTDDFAPHHRHEAWANRDWPAIGPVFDTVPIGQFHNHAERFALGAITVHVSQMAAQTYDRQAGRARRDGVDGLIVEILLAGETRGDAAGIDTANDVGGMAFNDLAQAHRHATNGTRTLMLSIPRNVAGRAGIDVVALHGRHVSPAATSLLRNHLLSTHSVLPHLDAATGERLGQTALDLLTVALDIDGLRTPAATRQARDAALKLAATLTVESNLGSPLLTVTWLCARLGVSQSRLYRLFENDGGVQALIRNQRLDRVAATLALGDRHDRLVDLAERWGFSDAAHLVRAFRDRFGMTPGSYRALHGGASE